MKLYKKKACELSRMLRERKISSEEICRDVLERIDSAESSTNAYITVCDDIIEQAKAIDKAVAEGRDIHPLAGIPIAVKDNISTKGLRTTCASRMLENYVPPYDAQVITRLRQAGMVITGKTNMDEFAMGSSTENSYFGCTHNPYNYDHSAGGSSGGSAAAVAGGEAILALGSDTGGSVRQPASFCGITGLKPTYGSVSRYGLIAFASSLEQVGVLGRCAADTAMLYSLICGHDSKDAATARRIYGDFGAELSYNIKGMKIGIPEEYFGADVSQETAKAVYASISCFEKMGAEVRRISLPNTKYAVNTYYIISSAEASSNLARYDGVRYGFRAENCSSLAEMYERTRSEGFGSEVKRRIMLGTFVLSSGFYDDYYKKALSARNMIRQELLDAFKECDIIITPTYPTPALRLGDSAADRMGLYNSDIFTVPANISGLPAMSVPCGMSSAGLPIGMQLMGAPFSEQLLFNAAYAFECFTDECFAGGVFR